MFAQGGEQFAERQVGALLASLRIPAEGEGAALGRGPSTGWADDFLGPPGALAARAAQRGAAAGWSSEFASARGALGEQWAQSLGEQQAAPPAAWGVDEFVAQRGGAGAAAAADPSASAAATEQTRALVDALSSVGEPKFQNSKFLSFVSKMSRGELVFEGNGVRERAGAGWAGEFAGPSARPDWASEYAQPSGRPGGWAAEFAPALGGEEGASWADSYERFLDETGARPGGGGEAALQSAWGEAMAGRSGYAFAPQNAYSAHPDPLAEGVRLFRTGVLSEAALALEAAAAREPGNAAAWRLLGTVHAENDDDVRAIGAMATALRCEPANREVLLSLGVSHTNELEQQQALGYVVAWLREHPQLGGMAQALPPGAPLDQVVACFRAASAEAPRDADVLAVLGVLASLGRDYEAAEAAFGAALALRPEDYSLWNKLGATRANSARSGESVEAYRRALELKPNYVRAWCNLGIAYANQGDYAHSAALYLRALSLNPAADSLWGYLRISLSCLGRADLLPALDAHHLPPLLAAFPLK